MINCACIERKKKCRSKHLSSCEYDVYGEWIRTFTFNSSLGAPSLPIVQPGSDIPFPIATIKPHNIQYIEENNHAGILVPPGDYRITVTLNPSEAAQISLLVNGQLPLTRSQPPFTYTQQIMNPQSSVMNFSYYVNVSKEHQTNLITLQNTGTQLLTLNNILNTTLPVPNGSSTTSIITQVQIQRLKSK